MIMDRIAASKVYAKKDYTNHHPLDYYKLGREHAPLHDKTRKTLELLLLILDKHGEEEMVRFIKKKILCNQKMWDDKSKWPMLIRKYMKYYQLKM